MLAVTVEKSPFLPLQILFGDSRTHSNFTLGSHEWLKNKRGYFHSLIELNRRTAARPENPRIHISRCRRHVESTAASHSRRTQRCQGLQVPPFPSKLASDWLYGVVADSHWLKLASTVWQISWCCFLSVVCWGHLSGTPEVSPGRSQENDAFIAFLFFLFFTLVKLEMEGVKDGLSFKGVAERLTLGITRVLGVYDAQLASYQGDALCWLTESVFSCGCQRTCLVWLTCVLSRGNLQRKGICSRGSR